MLWIDLEMTGLNPDKEVVIEIAAIVTELNPPFQDIDQYHCVIRQHQEYLDRMDEWNAKVHRASGLYDMIPSGKTPEEAEQGLITMIDKYFPQDEMILIAGNSIAQDRRFIKKYFHVLESRLHYRMLDVTSWKLLLEKGGVSFKKSSRHRALDDIQDSIKEMNFYFAFIDTEKWKKEIESS